MREESPARNSQRMDRTWLIKAKARDLESTLTLRSITKRSQPPLYRSCFYSPVSVGLVEGEILAEADKRVEISCLVGWYWFQQVCSVAELKTIISSRKLKEGSAKTVLCMIDVPFQPPVPSMKSLSKCPTFSWLAHTVQKQCDAVT